MTLFPLYSTLPMVVMTSSIITKALDVIDIRDEKSFIK